MEDHPGPPVGICSRLELSSPVLYHTLADTSSAKLINQQAAIKKTKEAEGKRQAAC